MANDIKDIQQKLVSKLEAVFTNTIFVNPLKDKKYQKLIEEELTILSSLKNEKASDLIKQYNKVTTNTFVFVKPKAKQETTTLIDKINYFDIYTMNVYKIDLNALLLGKDAKIEQKEVSDAKPVAEAATAFGGMTMPTMGEMRQQMGLMQANMQLQQKIMSGEVYMFKSKPKLVLILKWVLAFILLFLALACAFVSIGIFALDTGVISGWLNANQPVDSSIKIDGVPYTILFVMCIIYAYQHLSMLVSVKSKKVNENKVYSFRWTTYIFIVAFIIFIFIFGGIQVDAKILSVDTSEVFKYWWAGMWYIGYILLIIFAALVIVAAGICAACKPKVDTDRMNSIIQQLSATATASIPPANG